ncbi:cytochrome b [Onishia taeanensis]|uniref:Cytochrome b n=1 Tax=Onishia taeanensis TaxID=284577 RepID=A0A328XNR6_9GAMM|nr:cytochrome b/b6 domain-containing protein [Halomonas taeanensis]RAR61436.1 cytochrome b [Halomonas taeanensis]
MNRRKEDMAAPTRGHVKVWDPVVRLFHWIVVMGVTLNYFVLETGEPTHRYLGYTVFGALVVRLVWGFVGSHYARFSQFVASPTTVAGHLARTLRLRSPRYLGHNPAGGAMMVVLMIMLAALCITGWMQTLDAFWGVMWVQDAHELCANLIVALACIHVISAILESVVHRENLILAMITGRKRTSKTSGQVNEASAGRR